MALIHKSNREVWPFNYISNFKVRVTHRNHMIKNSTHFVTEILFIKYKIEPNTNFVVRLKNI